MRARIGRRLAAALVLASAWAGGEAAAQPSGPGDQPERNRLALSASEGKVLSMEARFVPTGMQYAAVRVTMVNPGGTGGDRVFLRSSAFRLMTHQGTSYSPADDTAPLRGGASAVNRCGLIYLVGSRPASCDLIFLVPAGVTSGFIEFVPSPYDVISVPVAIRE
jgi:hypothetical protein